MKLFADFLVSIAETFILFYFYQHFFKYTKLSSKQLFLLYLFDSIFCFVYSMLAQTPLQRMGCGVFFILFPLLFYTGRISYKLSMSIIYFSTSILLELLVKALLLGYHGDFISFYSAYEYNYLIGGIISKTLSFVVIYLYTCVSRIYEYKIPFRLCSLLFITPTLSILLFCISHPIS